MRPPRLFQATMIAVLCPAGAWAGPLVITPTTVAIAPERRSAVVEVENAGDEPVDLQFRAYDWRQDDGRDVLTPSDGLIVSPPIATVAPHAPHAKQLFRVLQTDAAASGATERSWRLRLNQLPRADQPAVAVSLEFLLPVFQTPAGAAARLTWREQAGQVTVTNSGNRRARISALALMGEGASATPVPGAASAYLLSGASRRFALPAQQMARAAVHLVGMTDTGAVDVPALALAAR